MTQLELEKGFQEIWKLFAESDKKFEKIQTEIRETWKELDKKQSETDKQLKKTDKQLKETDKKLEKLIGRWSLFVEGMVAPAAIRLFQERGIAILRLYQHAKVSRDGQEGMEIDILGINGEFAVLIEAKSTLDVHDVDEHIERLQKFKNLFPEYADRKAIGAIAGIVIHMDVDKYAYKKGLFVIAQSGNTVKILNDRSFRPKAW
ncbi:MAG: DUF3782 domain-containing protein [Candidatus Omnitrophota bacterium]|jgi:hypothetical protein|nr:MAG: DUF3782 domain-containing protein [Candidatus Omnitrophota bacterium]